MYQKGVRVKVITRRLGEWAWESDEVDDCYASVFQFGIYVGDTYVLGAESNSLSESNHIMYFFSV